MKPAPLIRKATLDDVAALRALIPLSVRALSGSFCTPEQIESGIRHAFGVDTQLIADGTFLVAETGNHIVGCGGWSWRRKIYGGDQVSEAALEPLAPATDAARIRAFFVHPEWARRGIGSALLGECSRAAAKAGFRRLELLGTLPGEQLYRAWGFAVLGYEDCALPDGIVVRWVRMGRDISAATNDSPAEPD